MKNTNRPEKKFLTTFRKVYRNIDFESDDSSYQHKHPHHHNTHLTPYDIHTRVKESQILLIMKF